MTAWDWAARAWQAPDARSACLDLQDAHGQCVSLLLWRLWALAEGRAVDGALLQTAVATAIAWDGEVIRPLRKLRTGIAAPDRRKIVLGAELAAERGLIEALAALPGASGGAHDDGVDALSRLTGLWSAAAPAPLLRRLVDAVILVEKAGAHGG